MTQNLSSSSEWQPNNSAAFTSAWKKAIKEWREGAEGVTGWKLLGSNWDLCGFSNRVWLLCEMFRQHKESASDCKLQTKLEEIQSSILSSVPVPNTVGLSIFKSCRQHSTQGWQCWSAGRSADLFRLKYLHSYWIDLWNLYKHSCPLQGEFSWLWWDSMNVGAGIKNAQRLNVHDFSSSATRSSTFLLILWIISTSARHFGTKCVSWFLDIASYWLW